jgi:16S rRNA (adenine1518-N6/adenine1519-N6)-dimethyltransferase
LDAHGLGTLKKYGQHFLVNPDIREKLLDALELSPGDAVWEIGPGLGAMTAGLLERGASVTAFEVDRGFSEVLRACFTDRFELVEGDALKTWRRTASPGTYLLGNLPYNIAAILLANFIEGGRFFKRMVVTVQREVARRITAKPGSKDYSSFSVLCGSAYTLSPLMVIKGASFYPAPRVDSQGIRFDLRTDVDPRNYPPLFKPLVRSLFASRRKTLGNNLRAFVSSYVKDQGDLRKISADALAFSGIDPRERAEGLSPARFAALAAALTLKNSPGER